MASHNADMPGAIKAIHPFPTTIAKSNHSDQEYQYSTSMEGCTHQFSVHRQTQPKGSQVSACLGTPAQYKIEGAHPRKAERSARADKSGWKQASDLPLVHHQSAKAYGHIAAFLSIA